VYARLIAVPFGYAATNKWPFLVFALFTLVKDLQLFLVSKGEEKAAEDQQRVMSALEDE
jgi:hypothetical protein